MDLVSLAPLTRQPEVGEGDQAGNKKSPDHLLIRGCPFFLVSLRAVLVAVDNHRQQAGLLTPGST
jgi:hypothetical protein